MSGYRDSLWQELTAPAAIIGLIFVGYLFARSRKPAPSPWEWGPRPQ